MAQDKYEELKTNLELRNKLLKLGIGCPIIGPTARCNKSSIYIFKW